MIIKIDNREKELINIVQHNITHLDMCKNIQLEITPLPLGDIIISNGTEDLVIFERKTIKDLAASIKDGRYVEQSYRLNGSTIHNHNIIYLIEGDISKFNSFNKTNSVTKTAIYSALNSILLFKGFSVVRSFYLEETGLIICNCAYKIKKSLEENKKLHYSNLLESRLNVNANVLSKDVNDVNHDNEEKKIEKGNMNSENQNQEKAYVRVIKKIKKENVTPSNIGEIMLCQIPFVSSVSALAVLEKFKSFHNLMKEINENEHCLNNVCYLDSNQKSRKLNKNCIKNIIMFLKNNKSN